LQDRYSEWLKYNKSIVFGRCTFSRNFEINIHILSTTKYQVNNRHPKLILTIIKVFNALITVKFQIITPKLLPKNFSDVSGNKVFSQKFSRPNAYKYLKNTFVSPSYRYSVD